MAQRTDETTQQFFVRINKQAIKCKCADKDKEIKQQIVLCTNISKLRKYSFQNPNKTLQDLLTTAKTFELMDHQIEELEKETIKQKVNTVKKTKFLQTSQAPHETETKLLKRTCYRCGNEFPHTNKCLALGKSCHSCEKIGHFATVCKTRKQNEQNTRIHQEKYKRNKQGYTKPLSTIYKDINESENPQSKLNEGELYSVNAKQISNDGLENFEVTINIENIPITVLTDTETSINILNFKTFEKINNFLKRPLRLQKSKTNHKNLLSGNDAKLLGLIQLNTDVNKKLLNKGQ
ncbi:uncharacterized protein LOC124814981 [Hydra vulgaris]|uniref:uncharacterized protein LOC124814981 n=1 Tax=Hydra vulgaris TaxID=6087 RepID=UPI001F5F1CEE|nr:uncharacterized protein LOC124814981 [Hydra vulgaris]